MRCVCRRRITRRHTTSRAARIDPAPGTSLCVWKGAARFWTLSAGGVVAKRCAWSYPKPTHEFEALRDHLAIYAHAMDECRVGGEIVVPQPGDFYGGWTTPNLRGTVKGGSGTQGW
ncbi:hypothetical protein JSE7799_00216 [Jannaschia seosinensis]|uniref:DUF427 domain-containing protein n=1 Tax=Jannaschia seosinensis TaxID=313367 RepID=A0A0M7B6A8_9RHOB|nr:DUF427 domain-containing protein [Jannaschia seosinensis]CUH12615.1 hypothetical protein JSE7799_00216 [Jannaschia seosinensis]